MALVQGGSAARWNVLDNLAFDHFYNLEYDQALAGFVAAAAEHPESAAMENHIAQTILYREMFRAGMLQTEMLSSSNSFFITPKLKMSAADERHFTDSIHRAMDLAQSRSASDPNDATALYALGVSYSLLGQYNFMRKAYLDALRDMTHARKFHERATRIDPSLVDAQLTQGVYDYVIGSLHFGWKMIGFLAGFQGNRERGIATIRRVAGEGNTNQIDAAIVLTTICRRDHRSADAIALLKPLIPLLPRNYLLRLELAGMYGDQGDRVAALNVLDQVEQLWHARAPGYEKLTPDLLRTVRERILTIASNGVSVRG